MRLSRTHPKFLVELFKQESPEVANGIVEIKSIAREPGARSKVAVYTEDPAIDPVGSCVGQRGSRVNTISSELAGEKIDLIEWSPDPAQFVADALSPAEIGSIDLNESEKKATVYVTEAEQSLAIGKGGQNVRLAAKLTGWKIDIVAISDLEPVETETEEADDVLADEAEVFEELDGDTNVTSSEDDVTK